MKVLIACEYSGVSRRAFEALGHEVWSADFEPAEDGAANHYQGDCFDLIEGWEPVQFTAECDPDGYGWCGLRDIDPCECSCIGPTEDDVEYKESATGVLLGRRKNWKQFDLMIAHPPCTFFTVAAAWALQDANFEKYPGVGYHQKIKGDTLTGAARRAAQKDALDFVLRLMAAPIKMKAIENPVGQLSTLYRKPDQTIQPWWFGDDASKATCLWLQNLPLLQKTNEVRGRIVNGKERWGNQTDSGQNKLPPSKDRWKLRSKTYNGIAKAMAEQWGGVVL